VLNDEYTVFSIYNAIVEEKGPTKVCCVLRVQKLNVLRPVIDELNEEKSTAPIVLLNEDVLV
jgi:hypothetical protein